MVRLNSATKVKEKKKKVFLKSFIKPYLLVLKAWSQENSITQNLIT